jgi:AcrR family transcriptional regulator
MIALVSEGLAMPPAEAVAARAGVGLRTVFRLFEDMDGLYRGIQAVMTERLGGLLEAPIEASDWRQAIDLLIDRRSEAFEIILPLQIAADGPRMRSAALREGRARLVQGQRDALLAVLPAALEDLRFRPENIRLDPSIQAAARANALVIKEGIPFRDAYRRVAEEIAREGGGQS